MAIELDEDYVEARANLQVREGDQVVVDAPEAAPSAATAEALPLGDELLNLRA